MSIYALPLGMFMFSVVESAGDRRRCGIEIVSDSIRNCAISLNQWVHRLADGLRIPTGGINDAGGSSTL